MAKKKEKVYDFSKLDQDKEHQKFLNISLTNEAENIDLEKYKKGIERFDERFLN